MQLNLEDQQSEMSDARLASINSDAGGLQPQHLHLWSARAGRGGAAAGAAAGRL